jgi:hypothetical protein
MLTDVITQAYLGGLFEGELGISCCRVGRLCLGMTDKEIVEGVYKLVRFGHFYGPYDRGSKWKQVWFWEVSSFEEIQAVACLVWKFLGTRRRGQIVSLLEIKKKQKVSNKVKDKCPKGHLYNRISKVNGKFNHRSCDICSNEKRRVRRQQIKEVTLNGSEA